METPKIGEIWVSTEAAGYIPAGIRVQISPKTQGNTNVVWYTYLDSTSNRPAGITKNNNKKDFCCYFRPLQKGPKSHKHWKRH